MKKILLTLTILTNIISNVSAFENYIVTTNGKLTDISIEYNDIINVYPLITLYNEKNTLMVQPLKIGKTRFCVLKNNKEKIMFEVEVLKDKTIINNVQGFEILSLDMPPLTENLFNMENFVLDEPPKEWGDK